MKTCLTCRNRIDVMASRCPYCTTEVDFNGIAVKPQRQQDHSQYQAQGAGAELSDGAAALIFLMLVSVVLMYWLEHWWPFVTWLALCVLSFIKMIFDDD